MNLVKLFMYHEDQNTSRSFLVYRDEFLKFGCVCKKCFRNIKNGASMRLTDDILFTIRCDYCRITERVRFTENALDINYILYNKLRNNKSTLSS